MLNYDATIRDAVLEDGATNDNALGRGEFETDTFSIAYFQLMIICNIICCLNIDQN